MMMLQEVFTKFSCKFPFACQYAKKFEWNSSVTVNSNFLLMLYHQQVMWYECGVENYLHQYPECCIYQCTYYEVTLICKNVVTLILWVLFLINSLRMLFIFVFLPLFLTGYISTFLWNGNLGYRTWKMKSWIWIQKKLY